MSAPVAIDVMAAAPAPAVRAARPRYRYPGDAVRLVALGAALVVILVVAVLSRDGTVGSAAVARHAATEPGPGERLAVVALDAAVLIGASGLLAWTLARRRFRLALSLLGAGMVAALAYLALDHLAGAGTASQGWLRTPGGFPSPTTVAAAAAAAVGVEPWLERPWQRLTWSLLFVLGAVPVAFGAGVAGEVLLAALTGATVGVGLLVALGVPDRRLDGDGVVAALARLRVEVREAIPAAVDAKASRPFLATAVDGRRLFVKVLGADQRVADLLYRSYRGARLRGLGDVRPAATVVQAAEHEALVALAAGRAGVTVPPIVAVGRAADGSALVVMEAIDGTSMASLPSESLTDELLQQTWREVAVLHDAGIAHRALHPVNIVVDRDQRPVIVDFGFSELAAGSAALDADVAELLASTTALVGAPRAVAAAIAVSGPGVVSAAAPYLQPLALSQSTRRGLTKAGLGELTNEVAETTGQTDLVPADVERIRPRTVLMVAVAAGAFYFLLPQLANAGDSWRAFRAASWNWLPVVIAMSAVTYVGAAIAMLGCVPQRVPFVPTLATQAASSFINRVTPANIGGMALNCRLLQKSGADAATGVAGVGLNSLAGAIVHGVLLVVFFIWSGSTLASSFALPSVGKVLLVVAVLVVLAGIVVMTPAGRRRVVAPAGRAIRSSLGNLAIVGRSPTKLLLLFGGSLIVTLAYIAALAGAVAAFHADLSFATVGAVYLGASALASASPTPGNLGALEATLAAGLIGVGMPSPAAVSTVLTYRVATFWLPVLPGWLAWHLVQKWGYV